MISQDILERPTPPEPAAAVSLSRQSTRKVLLRLMPLLWAAYLVAFLDRVNVSFAAIQMNERLGFDPRIYGLGAGLFFIGYIIFEVPSNVLLHRLGARIWIARIMVVWGLLSAACMFIRTPGEFYVLRFLLGVGEAGFFPGVIFYLNRWVPPADRARCVAYFLSAAPVAGILGALLAGLILDLDGVGNLQGWQWLFLLEGLPAVLLGLVVLFVLPETPDDVDWMTPSERANLRNVDRGADGADYSLRDIARSLYGRSTALSSVTYFFLIFGLYGFSFWIPQVMREISDAGNATVGLLTAIPSMTALAGMLIVGRYANRPGQARRSMLACTLVTAGASFGVYAAGTGAHVNPATVVVLLSLSLAGIWSTLPPFWAGAGKGLTRLEAAVSIAAINSVGNLGGFLAPVAISRVLSANGGIWPAFLLLGGVALLASGTIHVGGRASAKAPDPTPAVAA